MYSRPVARIFVWGVVLSKVKGGGGSAGACSRDFVLNPCAAKSEYIRFKQILD